MKNINEEYDEEYSFRLLDDENSKILVHLRACITFKDAKNIRFSMFQLFVKL